MSNDDLRKELAPLLHRVPFHSFVIEFTSGSGVVVSHPESVVARGTLFLYRGVNSAHQIFHGSSVCQLIEVIPTPRPS